MLVGTVVAITSGVVGVFTVTRGQSFAGHALADVATTGGAGAFLIGLNQFWGFLVFGIGTAVFLEIIGVQRRRGRDVATGVVLGAALGLAALFLYLGSATTSTTGASFTVLFGSIFVIAPATVPALVASGLVALAVVLLLSRVLLLSSLSPDIAVARGVPVRTVGAAYLVALAVSVSLSAVAIGAVLSTALLIGPAATALRVARGPVRAMATAALTGVIAVWLGIILAYDSYYWPPRGHGWPVSFFIVAFVVVFYLLTCLRRPPGVTGPGIAGRAGPPAGAAAGGARGEGMFSGFMMNTWIAATIVAVIAGVVGFFAVLRGSTFAAHAIPNGGAVFYLAGRAWATVRRSRTVRAGPSAPPSDPLSPAAFWRPRPASP